MRIVVLLLLALMPIASFAKCDTPIDCYKQAIQDLQAARAEIKALRKQAAEDAKMIKKLSESAKETDGKIKALLDKLDASAGQVTKLTNAVSVSKDGNVGIGTTEPKAKLHVVGSGMIMQNNGETDINFKDTSSSQNWQVGTNANGWYVFDDAYRFVVKKGGNVGIGTTSPQYKLDVAGKVKVVGSGMIMQNNGETDINFIDTSSSQNWQVGTNVNGWYVHDDAYRLVVKKGGNVGIGTTSPQYKLDVAGKVKVVGSGMIMQNNGETDINFIDTSSSQN
ncbi:hypothetical protein, partial [Candidatus Parabeggiatoa sp. HSG14]|uniref:hypothetical protein n=1 Tax=Candidatus Parabeggiatoa sp. HSG14 TaxID=3055593 RepID=UPI0025A901B5|nr:hypothetical protein [Thiotrichales bacterium HSG14]